jgi:hypothetical protein
LKIGQLAAKCEGYGTDQGKTAAAAHRQALVDGLDKIREALGAFKPDFVVIWGDDQYENFNEDIIPPFCILAYDKTRGPAVDIKGPRHAGKRKCLERE